jgi:DNA-binding CsgD family transcriptional regulator
MVNNTPGRLWLRSRDSLSAAVARLVQALYKGKPLPTNPASSMIPTKTERNNAIYERYMAGERAVDLAREYGISVRRINRLITRIKNRRKTSQDDN